MLKILLLLISIAICNASTCTNDEIYKIDDNRIKILDPSLNIGEVLCIDHGNYQKGCNDIYKIKPVCTLTPIGNENYHFFCKWQSMENFNIIMRVNDEHNKIIIDLYPKVDPSPFATFIMFLILLTLWWYMIRSENRFFEAYAGALAYSILVKGQVSYDFFSGIC